uniref:Uncharacterized protein n=1 Tax=Helianthus annuus TaxID=4232 RepID=A0A251S872_HELAN
MKVTYNQPLFRFMLIVSVILGGNHSKYTEVHDLCCKRCGCGVWVGCSGDEDLFLA